jgi:hypothetical protein
VIHFASCVVAFIGGTAILAGVGGTAGVVWAAVFAMLTGMLGGIIHRATS